jgi:hypothetical protein
MLHKVGFAILICVAALAQQPSTKNGEWPYYTADLKGSCVALQDG